MDPSETPTPPRRESNPVSAAPSGGGGAPPAAAPARRVAEMPLFPLDVVLFPAMPLPLHIFEERYREMVDRCIREEIPFGIVLATGVDPVTGLVQTAEVGCSARIAKAERLPDGRMNIEVVGGERFRLLDSHEQLPYRVGLTEPFAEENADPAAVAPLTEDVSRLLREFLTRRLTQDGQDTPDFELPDEPARLSYLTSAVLPVDNAAKQDLLAAPDVLSRLTAGRDLLRREVTRLRRADESRQVLWEPVEAERYAAYRCNN